MIVILGKRSLLGCGAKLAGHVQLHDFVTVSGMTGITQFVRLGVYSFVGAMNKVTKDILPYMIAEGNPSVHRIVNTVGLKRRGFDNQRICNIKHMMLDIFDTHILISDKQKILSEKYQNNVDALEIIQFINHTIKGVAKKGFVDKHVILQ